MDESKPTSGTFDTSVPNISIHISNILKENELQANSVIKEYLNTASDGKQYTVSFYSLDMIDEIDTLNRLVVIFLETAEFRAKNRNSLTMGFWKENVNKILEFNEQQVLHHAGSISNAQMEEKVQDIYETFDKKRKAYEAKHDDLQDLEELNKKVSSKRKDP